MRCTLQWGWNDPQERWYLEKMESYGWQWFARVCFFILGSLHGKIKTHCPTRLQLRILQRAMRMLRQGGKIVYSTCSLNPVENEAVVAEALRTVPGKFSSKFIPTIQYVNLGFELVEVSESLPSLIRRPGLTKWLPTVGRDLEYFETYEHYVASLPGGKGTARLTRSHWPPAEELGLERWYVRSAAHWNWFPIKDSIRIYPHLQDTGGFFIGVLQHRRSTVALRYEVASLSGYTC